MSLFRSRAHVLGLLALLAVACTRKTVSFNSRPGAGEVTALAAPGDTLTTTAQKGAPKLSTAGKKAVLTKAEEKAAKDEEKAAQRKKPIKKKIFLGERVKKAFVKSGPKGRNQIIEVFYYLKTFRQPDPMAPAVYYYSAKKHKIYKATGELDASTDKVLHGSYKKTQNNQVLETGYFANGTRHLRWEKFDNKGTLTAKTHYEMGFPRDANISYYDAGRTMLREVVPYVNGKLEGDYVKFRNDGRREWTGHFENGHRVGEWTNFGDYKKYPHYVFQYGESGYEPEVEEPELVREYSRGGSIIFDKEKNVDKRGEADPDAAPVKDTRRPGNHGAPVPRPPLRKAQDRRPGYHPPVATPPVVSPTPGGTVAPAAGASPTTQP
jgi:antitoxin component YwqK of YwqJK toxin-antitoxin module